MWHVSVAKMKRLHPAVVAEHNRDKLAGKARRILAGIGSGPIEIEYGRYAVHGCCRLSEVDKAACGGGKGYDTVKAEQMSRLERIRKAKPT